MLDLGFDKLALISVVALVVLGPEKLPRVARTVGTLLGKAQRYVADVKNEVNRSIELEDLKKMKESMEAAARDVESSVQSGVNKVQGELNSANEYLNKLNEDYYNPEDPEPGVIAYRDEISFPEYKHPNKNWRTKRSAVPAWYKARAGTRTRALSGAARVARFRPPKPL